ncbi:hypothetical protein JOF41_000841 [Saccharothrix coeruleofusca]|uniref:hypothetical protein n=1 Tax=Saccharothrix coeruleofusca TaxID=33919 RepID=UPI0027DC033C|nr:hypothetical protein [Saccharothrix coeruleofusca]MBP2334663.1 hypothetical protein [Saccharothrix coeruleofusca]
MAASRTFEEPALTVLAPPRPVLRRKRYLLPFGISAAVALVGAIALFVSGTVALPFKQVLVITGKLASKSEFFTDDVVRRLLMAQGVQVHITRAGSRSIATNDIDSYDFVFPSGQPAALLIRNQRQRESKYAKVHKPFFSPIVLATYRDYAEALQAVEQGEPDKSLYYNLPMTSLVEHIKEGQTWNELSHGLNNGNRVLAQTSDICSANSAATYLGLIAFVENGNQIPQDEESALALADRIKPLLTSQGLPGDDMSKQYLAPEGKGLAPVAVIYEHQYLAHQIRLKQQTGEIDRNRVLLYPEAQVQTVPELIALTPAGDRLGEMITNHPGLRKRALELGFRVFEPDGSLSQGQLTGFLKALGIDVPSTGVGDTETFLPSLPLLEKMIERVGDCP